MTATSAPGSRPSTVEPGANLIRREEYVRDDGLEPIATWRRQLSPGTYYWRCLVPARHLPGQVLIFDTNDVTETAEDEFEFTRQKGACIWQFAGNTSQAILMAAMQEQGIRVLLEADDNYILGADVMGRDWRRTVAEAVEEGLHSGQRHLNIAKFADGIIVSTENLADYYREINPNVYVCPNSIDPQDWPEPKKPNDGILRVGWAASHSHIIDVPVILRALSWMSLQRDVEVYVYGIGDVVRFPNKVRNVPWTDNLEQYRRSLALCDVHVCPLIETPWSAGKSDIKAMEAVMAGAWPIVAKAEPYRPWRDRTLVCDTAKDWKNAMRWLLEHRDEVPRLAAEAKDYVLSERTINQSIHLWRQAVCA